MNTETCPNDRDVVAWWLQQLGIPQSRFRAESPDYLIISPPKTGSTWLAENLRRHPDIFVASIKEIKYFSSFFKSLDLSWYLDQIAPGIGRIKGEASPSYSLLPVERIRLVRWLMPHVKIIFLMRDPIERAWSHARHNHRYREANFIGCNTPVQAVSDRQWAENFAQDWPLLSGDYLGQLRRWLSVFPREQVFIGFYESIANEPEVLFRKVLDFLGASRDVDLSRFPIHERVFPGSDCNLSNRLHSLLHSLLHNRSHELTKYLRDELALSPPFEWQNTLAETGEMPSAKVIRTLPFDREFDDELLVEVLKQEEQFPSAWGPVIGAYQGFNLIFHRGLVYALHVDLGDVQPADIPDTEIKRYQLEFKCFIAPSLTQLRARLDQFFFDRVENGLGQLPRLHGGIHNTRRRLASLETTVSELIHQVQIAQDQLHWLKPWFVLVHRVFRPIWRTVRLLVGMRPKQVISEQPLPWGQKEVGMVADRVPA